MFFELLFTTVHRATRCLQSGFQSTPARHACAGHLEFCLTPALPAGVLIDSSLWGCVQSVFLHTANSAECLSSRLTLLMNYSPEGLLVPPQASCKLSSGLPVCQGCQISCAFLQVGVACADFPGLYWNKVIGIVFPLLGPLTQRYGDLGTTSRFFGVHPKSA